MIIQSSNEPIVITFEEDVVMTALRITLWSVKDYSVLKEWTYDDVIIEGNDITCPLTQEETAAFPAGHAGLEIKWLNETGDTEFAKSVVITIAPRRDKEVM